jgi:hypothetical protein
MTWWGKKRLFHYKTFEKTFWWEFSTNGIKCILHLIRIHVRIQCNDDELSLIELEISHTFPLNSTIIPSSSLIDCFCNTPTPHWLCPVQWETQSIWNPCCCHWINVKHGIIPNQVLLFFPVLLKGLREEPQQILNFAVYYFVTKLWGNSFITFTTFLHTL